jgi:hypothetical protein
MSQVFDAEFVIERRPFGGIRPVQGKLKHGCLKCFMWGYRADAGTFIPYRFRVGSWITSNEPAMTVVDPDPDWGK